MDQPLELEGNKIDSLLIEMTDIVRKLRKHDAGASNSDSAVMHGGSTPAEPITRAGSE